MSSDVSGVATALSQAQFSARLGTAVLKKSMDVQSQLAQGMVNLIPPAPPLATQGTLGTRLNTFA